MSNQLICAVLSCETAWVAKARTCAEVRAFTWPSGKPAIWVPDKALTWAEVKARSCEVDKLSNWPVVKLPTCDVVKATI